MDLIKLIGTAVVTGNCPTREQLEDSENVLFNCDAQRLANSDLGAEQTITTLTGIKKGIIEQKYYEPDLADFMPIEIGQNAWMEETIQWLDRQLGDPDPASGFIGAAHGDARLASVESGLEKQTVKIYTWAKRLGYGLVDVNFAQNTGVWNKITSLEKSMAKNYKLSLQRFAFLGGGGATGLYNQATVASNTAVITEKLRGMTATELNDVLAKALDAFFANSESTELPDRWIVPADDFLGLGALMSDAFPVSGSTRIEILEGMFKQITGNPDAKILMNVYGQKATSGLGVDRHIMFKKDEENGHLSLPVQYTTTAINSKDNFFFESVAYSQMAPYTQYRPKAMLYFDY